MLSEATKNELAMMFQSGRINRLRFISYIGFLSVVKMAVGFILALVSGLLLGTVYQGTLIILFALLLAPIYIWWLMRRMNDLGITGKLILGALAIFVLCYISNTAARLNIMIFASIFFSAFTILIMMVPGDKTTNQFGEIPRHNIKFNKIFSAILPFTLVVEYSLTRLFLV